MKVATSIPQPVRKGQRVEEVAQHARVARELVEARRGTLGDVVRERPGGLRPQPLRVPVTVQEVVHDLEEEADVLAEGGPQCALVVGRARHLEADAHGRHEQPPCLQPVQLLEIRSVTRDVAVLATDHPERGLRELAGDLQALVGEREPERLGQQRVAGEESDTLSEGDVRTRSAAALVVVVERRQIVVHERERVDELERGSRGKRVLERGAVRLRHGQAEERADALPARLERVAQRLLEAAELRDEAE